MMTDSESFTQQYRDQGNAVVEGLWRLPLAEQPFGSLFQLQEGTHVTDRAATTGYATLTTQEPGK